MASASSAPLFRFLSSPHPAPMPQATLTPKHPSLPSHSHRLYPCLSLHSTGSTIASPLRPPQQGWRIATSLRYSLEEDEEGQDHKEVEMVGMDVAAVAFPSLAHANLMWFKSGYYNVQIAVREDEPEESLLRRFRREVMKAGVIQESKRRRFFEDKHELRKRKTREAAKKNRKRHIRPKTPPPDMLESSKKNKEEEEEDNWELPEGELPY